MSSLFKKFLGSDLGATDEALKSNSNEIVWGEITTNDVKNDTNFSGATLTDVLNKLKNDLGIQ